MPSPTGETRSRMLLAQSTLASPVVASILLAGLTIAALPGCTGLIGADDPTGASASKPKPREEVYPDDLIAGAADMPAPGPRFMRLTHSQWENTVRELFALDGPTGFADSLRPDVGATSVFSEDPTTLEVDANLWGSYQRAATELSARVISDAAFRARVIAEGTSSDAAGAEETIRAFGKRVHRRPLTDDEVAEYVVVYEGGARFFPEADPFHAAIATVVEAMLQSPAFLYRIETSTAAVDGKIPLDGYEIASRLSYTLWDSMPDDVLFSLAESGDLTKPAVVKEQAERMLADPRAKSTIQRFHHILLGAEKLREFTPSGDLGLSGGFKAAVLDSFDLDLEDKIFTRSLGLRALLAEPSTFVNAELARIYGVEGAFSETEFAQANLPEGERAGVFTHIPFLAQHTNGTSTDPIHRGLHLLERIVCSPPGAPPNVFDFPKAEPGQTTREVVEGITEQPGTACAGCHKGSINRFGFPFENFDAAGELRTEENGQPVVTMDAVPLDGEQVPVENGVELSHVLADSEQAHRCYTTEWMEFAYDRRIEKAGVDSPLVERLGRASLEDNASAKDLLVGMIVSDAFLTRSEEELPEEAP